MNTKGYLNTTSAMWGENRLLKFIVVIIGILVAWNTFEIQKSFDSHTTILIPLPLLTPFEIRGDQASESTLDAYSRYIIQLIGNFTPSNARRQFDVVLTLFTEDSYDEAKIQLYDLADRIEISMVSNSFFISKIISSPGKIEIHGTNRQFTSKSSIGSEKRIYIINFELVAGKFFLTQPIQQFKDQKRGIPE